MAPKKKTKARSKAKAAKKSSQRVSKGKTGKRAVPKRGTRTRARSKPKPKRSKAETFVNAEQELTDQFKGRTSAQGGRTLGPQSEDLRGVSRTEQADFESVDELVQEGNLFEAGAVAGVQEADDSDEKEVRTHELQEDDVPEEYRDKD